MTVEQLLAVSDRCGLPMNIIVPLLQYILNYASVSCLIPILLTHQAQALQMDIVKVQKVSPIRCQRVDSRHISHLCPVTILITGNDVSCIGGWWWVGVGEGIISQIGQQRKLLSLLRVGYN